MLVDRVNTAIMVYFQSIATCHVANLYLPVHLVLWRGAGTAGVPRGENNWLPNNKIRQCLLVRQLDVNFFIVSDTSCLCT